MKLLSNSFTLTLCKGAVSQGSFLECREHCPGLGALSSPAWGEQITPVRVPGKCPPPAWKEGRGGAQRGHKDPTPHRSAQLFSGHVYSVY